MPDLRPHRGPEQFGEIRVSRTPGVSEELEWAAYGGHGLEVGQSDLGLTSPGE